jgi:hypothetical protein
VSISTFLRGEITTSSFFELVYQHMAANFDTIHMGQSTPPPRTALKFLNCCSWRHGSVRSQIDFIPQYKKIYTPPVAHHGHHGLIALRIPLVGAVLCVVHLLRWRARYTHSLAWMAMANWALGSCGRGPQETSYSKARVASRQRIWARPDQRREVSTRARGAAEQ